MPNYRWAEGWLSPTGDELRACTVCLSPLQQILYATECDGVLLSLPAYKNSKCTKPVSLNLKYIKPKTHSAFSPSPYTAAGHTSVQGEGILNQFCVSLLKWALTMPPFHTAFSTSLSQLNLLIITVLYLILLHKRRGFL